MDRLCGLEGVEVDITMMRTPDGHGRVELTKFRNPELVGSRASDRPAERAGPPADHVRGRRLDHTVAGLRADGAELVGEVTQYEDM